MKTLECTAEVKADNTLSIPPEIAEQIRDNASVRVVILLPDPDEDADWARLTTEQFFKGYDEGDAIYDDLSPR